MALKAIGAYLGENQCKLVEMDLSANHSTVSLFAEDDAESAGKGWAVLGDGLARNVSLKVFHASMSDLEDEGLVEFGKMLASNSTLSALDLSSVTGSILKQNTSDAGWAALAKGVGKNKGVRTLNVKHNRMNDLAGVAFAKAVAENNTIIKLEISQNPIGPTAGKAFASALESNVTLASFDIADCALQEDDPGKEALRAIKEAWGAVDGRESNGDLKTINKFSKDGHLIPVAPPSRKDIEDLLSSGIDLSGLFKSIDNDEMFRATQDREVGSGDQILGGMVARV